MARIRFDIGRAVVLSSRNPREGATLSDNLPHPGKGSVVASRAAFMFIDREDEMAESTQHKLSRVRPPRVQITYDVEIGNAVEKKELPFVVGVLADLAGKNAGALPKLRDRKFTEIDRDNFSDIMASLEPSLAFAVPNRLKDDGSSVNVELKFRSMDDFEPISVIKQVPALRELLDARQRLNDLLGKLDGNDELDALLSEVIAEGTKRGEFMAALPAPAPAPAD